MVTYTFTTLDDAFGALGINDLGQIVGNYGGGGFLYDHGTFTNINDPDAVPNGTTPLGINNSGEIVGTYMNSTGVHGFVEDGGNFATIDVGSNTSVNGINDLGQLVGSYDAATGGAHGFLYSGGVITNLDVPNAHFTVPTGINDRGQIVGHYNLASSTAAHGFLYSNGVYTEIDDPLGVNGTNAVGINDAGDIVGVYADSSGAAHGFLYSHGTYTTIDDPLGTLNTALGINDRGQVVGYYNPSGQGPHAFIATPIQGHQPNPTLSSADQQTQAVWANDALGSHGDVHIDLDSFVFKPNFAGELVRDANMNQQSLAPVLPNDSAEHLLSPMHSELSAPLLAVEDNVLSGMHVHQGNSPLSDFHLL